jgi:diaminopimelate epimerase
MPMPKAVGRDVANTGVPHAVVVVDDLNDCDVAGMGRKIRYSKRFAPAGTNVDFVRYDKPSRAFIRTYERGVEAETFACGTGSVAAAVVGVAAHGMKFPVTVETSGGYKLTVDGTFVGGRFSNVTLAGPVKTVFQGSIDL